MTSVMTSRPVSSATSRRSLRPSRPMPWKLYGELRGLKAPPRRNCAPAAATCFALSRGSGRGDSTEQGPAMMTTSFAADDDAVGEGDGGAFGAEAAAGELVGRGDAVGLVHAGQHLELCDVEVRRACRRRRGWSASAPVVRWTLKPSSTMRSMTFWMCSSVAVSCMATIIVRVFAFLDVVAGAASS